VDQQNLDGATVRRDHSEFRDVLKRIRFDLGAALDAIAKKHDLKSLTANKCTFDPEAVSFNFKLEGLRAGAMLPEERNYKSLAQMMAYTKDEAGEAITMPDLGTYFSNPRDGRRYRIVGANTGDSVICARDDSKRFLFKARAVHALVTRNLDSGKTAPPYAPTDARSKV
jgi:hypothetical protein